ncbi:unnamed protein product, partial [Rotaria sordida]
GGWYSNDGIENVEMKSTTSLCRTSVDIIVLDDYLIDVGEQDKISYLNILEKYDSSIQSWILVTSMSIK